MGGVGKFDLNKSEPVWEGEWEEKLKKIGFTEVQDSCGKWDGVNSVKNDKPKDPYMRYLAENNLLSLYLEDMEKRYDLLYEKPTELPQRAYGDNWVARQGIKMLDSFARDRPWFLMVNYPGPHDPWDVTKEMKDRWEDVKFPLPPEWDKGDPEKINGVRQNYAAMLENIDQTVGDFLKKIKQRGELADTYIVFTADHGEMLGDFNNFRKRSPYRGSVQIPLVIWGPEVRNGLCSDALVELQDLAATMLDFGNRTMDEARDSRSLLPVLEGEEVQHRKIQYSALKDWQLISDKTHKFIVKEKQGEKQIELYNLKEDPWEKNNIAPENKDIVSEFKGKLEKV